MVHLLAAAALAAATPALASAVDQPAIFKVQDADTTIYLFGTFHALDGDFDWLDPDIRTAFEESDELILETLLPEPTAVGQTQPARLPAFPVVQSGSFLASTRMAVNAGRSQGMNVATGADMILRHLAEAEGKPVEGLETLELQLRMYDKLRSAQPGALANGAQPQSGAAPALALAMGTMQAAWKRGDQSLFVGMLDALKNGSPDTYRSMFIERNARWADWVAARLRQPGTVFVAVGAGHLAGQDSLLVRLAEHGIESKRVG